MWAQCDLDGQERLLMQAIVDHRKDGNAVPYADRFVYCDGKPRLKTTTAGWFLCIQWKNGTTSWERLSDMKESKPVEIESMQYLVQSIMNQLWLGGFLPRSSIGTRSLQQSSNGSASLRRSLVSKYPTLYRKHSSLTARMVTHNPWSSLQAPDDGHPSCGTDLRLWR
jgi:hypothetical protein